MISSNESKNTCIKRIRHTMEIYERLLRWIYRQFGNTGSTVTTVTNDAYENNDNHAEICSICLDKNRKTVNLSRWQTRLKCNCSHIYDIHANCLFKWYMEKLLAVGMVRKSRDDLWIMPHRNRYESIYFSCPMCRQTISSYYQSTGIFDVIQ